MKKLFYLATMLLSVSLFSCSSDDDKEVVTPEGYVVKEVAITSDGTQSKPLAGGKELTVTGSFATNSDVFIRPFKEAATKAEMDKDAVKLEVAERTTGSLKLKTPFLYGKYELLEKEGDKIYTLGNVYFKDAKVLTKIENQWTDYSLFYSDGTISKITISGKDGNSLTLQETYFFSYNDNKQLLKIERKDALGELQHSKEFTYSGTTASVKKNWEGRNSIETLTFNNNQLTNSTEEWEEVRWDEKENPYSVKNKSVSEHSYNKNGDLIKKKTTNYEDDINISVSSTDLTYDSSKSLFAGNELSPKWFWAYNLNTVIPLYVGLNGNVIKAITDSGSTGPWAGKLESNSIFDFNDDLYPSALYNVIEGKKAEQPAFTFSYQ